MYPIPRSIRSPQIEIFQNGLKPLSLFTFCSSSDIAQWFDKVLEHAMLINIHEYFTGQIGFELNDACDARFHLAKSSQSISFQMQNIEENVAFLEFILLHQFLIHLNFPISQMN